MPQNDPFAQYRADSPAPPPPAADSFSQYAVKPEGAAAPASPAPASSSTSADPFSAYRVGTATPPSLGGGVGASTSAPGEPEANPDDPWYTKLNRFADTPLTESFGNLIGVDLKAGDNPNTPGWLRGVEEVGAGLTSPKNLLLIGATLPFGGEGLIESVAGTVLKNTLIDGGLDAAAAASKVAKFTDAAKAAETAFKTTGASVSKAVEATGMPFTEFQELGDTLRGAGLKETDLTHSNLFERVVAKSLGATDVDPVKAQSIAKGAETLLNAGFTMQMLSSAGHVFPQFLAAMKDGNYDLASEYAVEGGANGLLGFMGAAHTLAKAGETFGSVNEATKLRPVDENQKLARSIDDRDGDVQEGIIAARNWERLGRQMPGAEGLKGDDYDAMALKQYAGQDTGLDTEHARLAHNALREVLDQPDKALEYDANAAKGPQLVSHPRLPEDIGELTQQDVKNPEQRAFLGKLADAYAGVVDGFSPEELKIHDYLATQDMDNWMRAARNEIMSEFVDDHAHHVWGDKYTDAAGNLVNQAHSGRFDLDVDFARHRTYSSLLEGALRGHSLQSFDPFAIIGNDTEILHRVVANRGVLDYLRSNSTFGADGRPLSVMSGSGSALSEDNGGDPRVLVNPRNVRDSRISARVLNYLQQNGRLDRFLASGDIRDVTPRVNPDNLDEWDKARGDEIAKHEDRNQNFLNQPAARQALTQMHEVALTHANKVVDAVRSAIDKDVPIPEALNVPGWVEQFARKTRTANQESQLNDYVKKYRNLAQGQSARGDGDIRNGEIAGLLKQAAYRRPPPAPANPVSVELFSSQNTEADLALKEALAQTNDPEMQDYLKRLVAVDKKRGFVLEHSPATGFWAGEGGGQNGEPSVISRGKMELPEARALAALRGMGAGKSAAEQNSVLLWHPDETGPHVKYTIELEGVNAAKAAGLVQKAGIGGATVEPRGKDSTLHIVDDDPNSKASSKTAEKIYEYFGQDGLSRDRGTGEFIYKEAPEGQAGAATYRSALREAAEWSRLRRVRAGKGIDDNFEGSEGQVADKAATPPVVRPQDAHQLIHVPLDKAPTEVQQWFKDEAGKWTGGEPSLTIESAKEEELDPKALKTSQSWASAHKLKQWESEGKESWTAPRISVLRTSDGDYIVDGVHRASAAAKAGEKVNATVFTVAKPSGEFSPELRSFLAQQAYKDSKGRWVRGTDQFTANHVAQIREAASDTRYEKLKRDQQIIRAVKSGGMDKSALKEINDAEPKVHVWHPQGYRPLPKGLAGWNFIVKSPSGDPVFAKGDMLVHPDHADYIINRLGLDESALRKGEGLGHLTKPVLEAGSEAKKVLLSGSPFHAMQLFLRAIMVGVNPIKIDPVKDLDSNPVLKRGVNNGLTLYQDRKALDQHAEGVASGHSKILSNIPVLGKYFDWYQDFLFNRMMPAYKASSFELMYRKYSAAHPDWTPDAAAKAAARHTNDAFGGQNWREMGRSATTQDWFNLTALAPDWLESEMRFAASTLRGGLGERNFSREQVLRMAAGLWGFARIVNLTTTGNAHYEAPFGVATKDKDGREVIYSIRTMPTDILNMASDPSKFLKGRMSPFVRTSQELATGRDVYDRKLSGKDLWVDVASNMVPIPVQATAQIAGGNVPEIGNIGQFAKAGGATAEVYHTPAQSLAGQISSERNENGPLDTTARNRSRAVSRFEDDLRSGSMTFAQLEDLKDFSSLPHKEIKQIRDNVKMTTGLDPQTARMVSSVSRMRMQDALQVWNTATSKEKVALAKVFHAKKLRYMTESYQNLSPEERLHDPTFLAVRQIHPEPTESE